MKVVRELNLHDIFILAHAPLFIWDLSKPKEKHIQGKTTSCLCDSVNKYATEFQILSSFHIAEVIAQEFMILFLGCW